MDFQSLVDRLPLCPGDTEFPLTSSPGGLHYITHRLPEFVGPDLALSGAIEQPQSPSVVIVSAAGAVGKSTMAREVAERRRAPFWDLSSAPTVGGGAMTGQLAQACGPVGMAGMVAALSSGRAFVIIDALDEARVKASQSGYDDFISNLASIASSAKGISFLLFARTQTAETTWLLLAERSVQASLLSIQPFTRQQSERYIDARSHLTNSGVAG